MNQQTFHPERYSKGNYSVCCIRSSRVAAKSRKETHRYVAGTLWDDDSNPVHSHL
ncbi:MAG TPA: hypothetical protein PLD59_01095 [Tepidisphaeraceae bacterium]|nr:hypothetical protein [Tepidisphaeraceae bacterium]